MPAARARVARSGGRGDGAHARTSRAHARKHEYARCVPTHDGLGRRDRVRAHTRRAHARTRMRARRGRTHYTRGGRACARGR
eukprot:287130-Pleurochrysis_carterae.AAC.2